VDVVPLLELKAAAGRGGFSSSLEHGLQRSEKASPVRPVTRAGGHELAEPLFVSSAEAEGVDEGAQDFGSGVRDQDLPANVTATEGNAR
jgi:hypothetical protein